VDDTYRLYEFSIDHAIFGRRDKRGRLAACLHVLGGAGTGS